MVIFEVLANRFNITLQHPLEDQPGWFTCTAYFNEPLLFIAGDPPLLTSYQEYLTFCSSGNFIHYTAQKIFQDSGLTV